MINCLEIRDFDIRNFENPAIGTFYAGLQAIALQENEPE